MPAPQIIPLPPFFEMGDGMIIRITAVDATTNATVAGVIVSGVSIDIDPIDSTADQALDTFSDPGSPFYFGDVAA